MRSLLIATLLVINACSNTENSDKQASQSKDEVTATQAAAKTINFLWRENQYDPELKDTVNTIIIDEEAAKSLSDAERAALGYVGTFVGSDCWWDGEATDERNNLKCKVLSALNLGYQCSEQHLGFLRKWFANDEKALEQLKDCPTIPYTATVQETFDTIKMTTKGDQITVWYAASGVNLREDQTWDWTEETTFQVNGDHLNIIAQKSSRE